MELADLAHAARRRLETLSHVDAVLVQFVCEGNPLPKGSMRTVHDRDGRVRVFSDNKDLGVWESAIHWSARAAMGAKSVTLLPVECVLEFVVHTPASREGQLWPIERRTGDIDKLTRATLDGMTGTVYADDSQVVRVLSSKRYAGSGRKPGVTVWVYEIPET